MSRRLVGWRPKSANLDIASARIRCLNPLAELRRGGYPVEIFDPRRAADYGLVVYSKLYDDASRAEAEGLKGHGARILVDLCDNHFHNPQRLPEWDAHAARLRRMLALADRVSVSTAALREVVLAEVPGLAAPPAIVGDAVETEMRGRPLPFGRRLRRAFAAHAHLRRLASERRAGRTALVWFGQHGSPQADGGMLDVLEAAPILARINRTRPLSLTIISNSRQRFRANADRFGLPAHYLEWAWTTFVPLLRAHDIAFLPITLNPFTRCKSDNRLVLSLWNGLGVVAGRIPSYEPYGAYATLGDLEEGLATLVADPALRRLRAERARPVIEARAGLPAIASQWRALFDAILTDEAAAFPAVGNPV